MSRKHPTCPYDGEVSVLKDGMQVYDKYEFKNKWFYVCPKCGARVGCHSWSKIPLGRMANAELREWKKKAHAAFDPLWARKAKREGISKGKSRRAGYKWLSGQLGIPKCHIGSMDIKTCQRVVELCSG